MNKLAILAVAASLAMAGTVRAAEVEVKLPNKGTDGGTMAFEPAFVKIASGDTVKLLSTDKGHDPEFHQRHVSTVQSPLSARAAKPLSSGSSRKACTA